jgi:hypothetical protein
MIGPEYPAESPPLTKQAVKSAFELPMPAALPAGKTIRLHGRSWSGSGTIKRVEIYPEAVSTSVGPVYAAAPTGPGGNPPRSGSSGPTPEAWRPAKLQSPNVPQAWVRWSFDWTPPGPGAFELRARATDQTGQKRGEDSRRSRAPPRRPRIGFATLSEAAVSDQREDQRMADKLDLTGEIAEAIDGAALRGKTAVIGYAGDDGYVGLSFRGSLQVHGPTQLAFWSRKAEGGVVAAIADDPKVSVLYYGGAEGPGPLFLTFRGLAHVDPAADDAVYAAMIEGERGQDPDRAGVAVVIDVESVQGFGADGGFEQAAGS